MAGQLLEFGTVEVELMASQEIVSLGEPPSADANPLKSVQPVSEAGLLKAKLDRREY
jgi:hypothetical protein